MTTQGEPKTNLFENNGANYAAFRPTYPSGLVKALADLCPRQHRALDVGCGTGQLTTLLSEHFTQVIGTDASQSQLASAQTADNIRYLHEPAEKTSLENHSVDLIVVAQAAHWFDLNAFYQEVKRIATPDAIIALISYGVPYIESTANASFQQGYWQLTHTFWPEERKHVENNYLELPFPFRPLDFPDFFIHKDLNFDEMVGYIRTWSAYKNAQKQAQTHAFETFFTQLEHAWGTKTKRHPITWPISVKVGKMETIQRTE